MRSYSPELAASIREKEELTDHYEDLLGTYLVKLSAKQISEADSAEAAKLLKMIGDFERISDQELLYRGWFHHLLYMTAVHLWQNGTLQSIERR